MQLHVDTEQEPIAGLMLLSRLLMDYANMKAQNEKVAEDKYPATPAQKEFAREVLTVHDTAFGTIAPGMTIVDASGRELGTVVGPEPDPTEISTKSPFTVPTGASTNVVPLFPQPALNLPGARGPAVLGVLPVSGLAPSATGTTGMGAAPSLPANSASVLSVDVDKQGLPWDERIHSSSKAKKGDGTWKIKRGLEAGVAERITAELIAAKLPPSVSLTPTVAGLGNPAPLTGTEGVLPVFATSVPNVAGTVTPQSDATVTLPPGGTSAIPVYVPPSVTSHAAPAGGIPLSNTGAVPIPGASANGAIPVAPVNPVVRFSQMMTKISDALGARIITQQQVLDAHRMPGIGLDQLQQAVLNPDKIPLIEAALGLA